MRPVQFFFFFFLKNMESAALCILQTHLLFLCLSDGDCGSSEVKEAEQTVVRFPGWQGKVPVNGQDASGDSES